MEKMLQKFWEWYEKNLELHNLIVSTLFVWQLFHLYWLTTHVVAHRVLGIIYFDPGPILQTLIIIADYFEIPALIGGTLFYLNSLRKEFNFRDLGFIFLINSQWLHLFWITDEFVIKQFSGASLTLPLWLAWIAIGIDYLELPVIYDTLRRFFRDFHRTR